jgi:glucose/arabinose dehydrogenase
LLCSASVVLCGGAGAASARQEREGYGFRPLLTAPVGVTHVAAPPVGARKLYVVQQNGRISVAVDGRLLRTPFLDLRRLVLFDAERGLLSMTFHPRYATNRRLYVDYISRTNHTKVVEYRANAAGTRALPRTARLLFDVRQPGEQHKGGQLAFGPDGRLYLSLGDGECCDDPANRAQDLRQPFGKLFRLDVSRARPRPELVALGLRNPWRFSFDRATGDLYIADVGAGLWEEIDYQPRAALGELVNYGWDAFEGPAVKEDKPPNPAGRLVFPVYAYGHDDGSCSITGGFVYRGQAVPDALGRYFFGDYCSGKIWSLRIEDGKATDVRREPFDVPDLTTFGEDARGELYAASQGGRVYKLMP